MIKIILAEDQKMLNSALTMLLNLEADLNVIDTLRQSDHLAVNHAATAGHSFSRY